MKVKNILKSFFSMFLILTILITSGLPVSASVKLPTGRETEWSENNILFYNPSGDDCVTINHPGEVPSGDQITWIGDSYSSEAENQGLISLNFEGVDYGPSFNDPSSYIQWGKSLSRDTATENGQSSNPPGIDVLKSIPQDSLRKYVVFALGTNDYGGTNGVAEEAANYIGEERTLVLVTPADRQGGRNSGELRIFNDVIEDFKDVKSRHSNVIIADWASVVSASDFNRDNIHLNNYTKWIDTIKSALASGGTSEVICPDDPCFDYDSSGDNANDHWDGTCEEMGPSYEAWLSTYVDDIIAVSQNNHLPWEGLMAQTIQESSGGVNVPCGNSNNPLGLKPYNGWTGPTCEVNGKDGKETFVVFNSIEESFNYYVEHIAPVREARGMFEDDPYSYIEYLQHRNGSHYATSASYVNAVSRKICGIQKWAKRKGIPISRVTHENFEKITSGDDGEYHLPSLAGCDSEQLDEGGLTEEQARQFVINYGANKDSLPSLVLARDRAWNLCGGPGGSNCVSFAKFFLRGFTASDSHGDGYEFASNLPGVQLNIPQGTAPKLWSIISAHYSEKGHVAVVLGIHNGTYIIGHASCERGDKYNKRGPGNGTYEGSGSAFIEIENSSDPHCWALLGRPHNSTGNCNYGRQIDIAFPSSVNTSKILDFSK